MSLETDYDVLIAGAGPTGMSAAIALHDFGYSVGIIDKHKGGLDFSRAILVNSKTLKLLKPFGVTEKILKAGIPFTSLSIRGPDGPLIEGSVGAPDADGIRPISLPQLETERCLLESLQERGITVDRPIELLSFYQDEELVQSRVRVNGEERTIRSSYLLGADGSHSVVREQLDIQYNKSPVPLRMYSQDAVLPWQGQSDLVIWILEEGAAIAMKLGENRVRFAATDKNAFDFLGFNSKIERTTWESEFDVFFAQVETYGKGRVWIAGDAAHLHSPIGGRGMNMGIADGIRFAEALRDNDFEGYAADRHAISGPWVRKNRILTEWMCDHSLKGKTVRRMMRGVYRLAGTFNQDQVAQKIFSTVAIG